MKIKPKEYLDLIDKETRRAYDIASKIRKKGYDPEDKVDIPLVRDMAERVEGLVSAVIPEIIGKGIPERIKGLEEEYGSNDWRVALKIALEVSQGKFCSFKSKEKAIEAGIRIGLAYVTLGIVSAPLEGFLESKIKKRKDGEEYLSCYFGGPIRAAGGTAASVSILIADFVRRNLGLKGYDIDEKEVKRYITEIGDYHERISRLQYLPSEEELHFLLKSIPIEITGDPTTQFEVSNYKDLPRVESNRVRGGMCLVVAEGICQKAKKLNKRLSKWGKEFGMEDWAGFLPEYLKIKEKVLAKGKKEKGIKPNYRYLEASVAGRPVFSYPLRKGGFRIRYGHSRANGLAAASISPGAMVVLNNFIATGTQLAIERPGKATAITACDSIEGPIVRLKDGSVLRVETEEQAKKIKDKIQKILFLGDMLFTYGEFFQNGHVLIKSGYVEEWWIQELKKAANPQELSEKTSINIKKSEALLREPLKTKPTDYEAYLISKEFNVPIHPRYTCFWHDINKQELISLCKWISNSNIDLENQKIILNKNENKIILEKLCVPHKVFADKIIIEELYCFLSSLGYFKGNKINITEIEKNEKENALDILNTISNFRTKAKCPIYLGCRMGRPEKAKLRQMTGRPHVLFPCGQEGGRLRSFQSALGKKYVRAEFPMLECPNCGKTTIYNICEICGAKTRKLKICPKCGKITDSDWHCRTRTSFSERKRLDIAYYVNIAKKRLKQELPPLVKGVRGMSSAKKIPEPFEKGMLRAKHDLYVNKDGTIRIDIIETPLTHFYPREIGTSVEKLRELGYERDIHGKILENEEQLLELFPQDLVLPECVEWEGACMSKIIIRICKFIDDLLVKFYNTSPFYNVKTKQDLIGRLVIGLAPHTSAGIVGRIIGFSKTQGYFAHPFFHCACRRNCLPGDETVLIQNSKNWKLPTFHELDNTNISNMSTQTINEKGIKQIKKVKNLVKNQAPENLILFKTQAGREIKVTPEHKMIVLENKKLIKKKAKDVKIGDKMIALSNLKVKKPIDYINMLDLYLKSEKKEKIRIHNLKKEIKKQIKKKGGLSKFLKLLKWRKHLGKKNQYGAVNVAINKDSLPLPLFEELNIKKAQGMEISYNKQKSRIKLIIPLNYELGFLVGLLLSDGYVRTTKKKEDQEKFVYQTVWAVSDKKVLKKVVDFCTELFRKPTITKRKDKLFDIVLSGRVYYDFFKKILEIKSGALNKRIPHQIINSDLKCVEGCLAGFIAGDGSIDKSHKEIIISSNNKYLLNDLGTLSLRLNLFPYYKKEKRVLTKGIVAEYYRKKNINYRYITYKLRFNSLDSSKILKFLIGEKKEKLKKCLRDFNPKGSRFKKFNDFYVLKVKDKQEVKCDSKHVYDIEIDSRDKTYFAGFGNLAVWDCDGDELGLIMLMDAFLNFSRQYLPSARGASKMDAPLVLTTKIDPKEIDDEVHSLDIVWEYPLEFYEATLEGKYPWDIKIEQVSHRLGKENQFNGFGFTHSVSDINAGSVVSSYKTLKTMLDKVKAQMELAEKIIAVNPEDVASLIITKHFLRDIKGNLRRYSKQEFRCIECNEKYRRIPLAGRCTKCNGKKGGKLVLTVAEGTVKKYLEPCMVLAKRYDLPTYLQQTLEILSKRINSIFGWETEKQVELKDFFK